MENANQTALMRMILENKAAAERRELNKQTVYSCEEILGSMKPVQNFAAFHAINKIDLQLIRKALLMDFVEENVDIKPKDAFTLALDLFLGFFEKAEDELDLYTLAANNANRPRKSVDDSEE